MNVIKDPETVTEWVKERKRQGKSVGFVPTMGALHEGHLSLVHASKKSSALTIVSIFVNPTQFNDVRDLEKYPRDKGRDLELLGAEGVDLVFLPDVEGIYPDGAEAWVPIDFGTLDKVLEGKFRPGHFQGVAQVVSRLLDIVRPDDLYMGQKDFQQIAIIRKMLALRNSGVRLQVVPTVRELHGLAMSSRNERLSHTDRMRAGKLYEALCYLKCMYEDGLSLRQARSKAAEMLDFPDFKLEYLELCDRTSLSTLDEWGKPGEMVALVACWLKDVRLIDNILF